MSHTPTPWDENFKFHHYTQLLDAYLLDEEEFSRAQTCVNACEGMEDPKKEIAALKARVAELEKQWTPVEDVLNHELERDEKVWIAHDRGVCLGIYIPDIKIWLSHDSWLLKATHFMFNRVPNPPKPQQ